MRHRIASLFTLGLILSPVLAYGQTVTAMWDASPPADQVTGYQVCIGTTSLSCNVQLASVSNTQTSYTFSPTGGVLHYVAVRAINPSGTGSYSSEATFSIPSFTQPLNQSSPVNVAITALNMSVSDPDASALNFTHTGLPPGLTLNASTGRVTGTPSAAGAYNVTIFVTDALVTVSRAFTWTVTAPTPDTTAPALAITSHTNGQTVTSSSATITGTATDSGRGGNGVTSVTVNGQAATGGTVTGSATANWSRAVTLSPGANTISVQASDGQGNLATQSITVNYSIPAVTSATITANLASPQNTGTAVTFTAAGSGGVSPRQYKFLLRQGSGANQVAQNWSTTATYTWTPTTAASYTITVWARSAGMTVDAAQASATMAYVINTPPVAPVTGATLTSNLASPQTSGTAVTFTAGGSGGVAPREFKFFVQQGSLAAQTVRNWSTSATYAWTPTTAASYTITVWARSAGVTVDAAQASATMAYTVNAPPPAPVTAATLTANLASPQNAGTAITFSAAGSGGVGPRQFKFLVQQGTGAAQMVRDWNTATTYAWTPATAASYTVIVWARSAGVTTDAAQASAQMVYVINTPPPGPVTSVTLASNLATPQNAGTAITFTAAGAGGVAPRQYKFLLRQGSGANQVAQNWSTTATYTWTPTAAASYTITVWARSAGVTVDAAQASATMAYVINTPPVSPVTGATLTSNLASPQTPGTAVTFTAGGSGGVAPREFKFFVQQGSLAAQTVQNWSTSAAYTWTPTTAASYTITVWARSAGVTVDAAQASATMAYTVNAPPPAPVTGATLTANLPSPQNAGTAITFGAAGSGGVGPRQFKFFVQQGSGAPQIARDWSTATTFAWTPATAASYTVIVWARSAGVTTDAAQASAQLAYVVNTPPPSPVTAATLSANLASPRAAGTAITFTAAGTGGVGPREFKFLTRLGGAANQVARDWSTATTYAWTPSVGGTYTITVWARSAGVTADAAQASAAMSYVINAPQTNPLTITGVTPNVPSPQAAGTPITFTAAASGGTGPYSFKWWLFDGTTWTMARDWNTTATYSWTPTAAGANYRIGVWARDSTSTADVSTVNLSVPYAITAPVPTPPPTPAPSPTPRPLALTGITSNVPSPQAAGVGITFTAAATGGTGPYSFKWWLFDGTTWTMVRDWSPTATYAWTPIVAGANYRIGVWARSATTTTDVSNVNLSVPFAITGSAPTPPPAPVPSPTPTPSPVSITGLTGNLVSPQATGTPITFTAAATGGTAPYSFKWWIYDGATWTMARNWSTTTTFTWTPTTGGTYRIGIWARDASTSADISAVNLSVPFRISGPAPAPAPTPTPTPTPAPAPGSPLELTSLTTNVGSPQLVGTPVTFTAAAGGGTAPYQFKWWLFDGTTWNMVRDWSSTATYSWTPRAPGSTYRIGVWVRDSTTTADVGTINTSVPFVASSTVAPLTAQAIGTSMPVPVAGSPVVLTALAAGGQAPYSFKWWVFDGTNWTMVRDWGGATFTWTPMVGGDYRIGVWVRSANTTADTNAVNISIPLTVR